MTTSTIQQLAIKVQELQLSNNQWLSGFIFLENETRFIQRLCSQVLKTHVDRIQIHEIEFINASLKDLDHYKSKLKVLVSNHENRRNEFNNNVLDDVDLKNIQDYSLNRNDINMYFSKDSSLKKELYTLLEGLIVEDKVKCLVH